VIVATSAAATVVAPAVSEIKRVETPIADDRLPKAESRSPMADDRLPKAENRLPTADNRKPIAAQPIDDRNSSPMRNFGLLAGLLAIGAAVVVYGKKKKAPHRETAGIDLIAVKALGAKQRLAVVDACGDRLLIATSEQGVQLLSKLEGGTGVHKIPTDFTAVLAQAENQSPVSTPHVTPVNTSKDLAGLVQLRARRVTWTSTDPLV
jgi:flagellar biogenesis protein FliO